MKKPLFICAITLVIATLLVTSAVSIPTAKVSPEQTSEMKNVWKSKQKLLMENLRAEIVISSKETISAKTVNNAVTETMNPIVFQDAKAYGAKAEHPIVGDSFMDSSFNPGTGTQNHYMPFAYDFSNATSLEQYLLWGGSNDGGCTIGDMFYWINSTTQEPLLFTYPDISYWGLDEGGSGEPVFYCTFIAENNAPELNVMDLNGDPSNSSNWGNNWIYWDLSDVQGTYFFDDITSIAIASSDAKAGHEFGLESCIIDWLAPQAYNNVPMYLYANASDPNSGQFAWWSIDCGDDATTDCSIDRIGAASSPGPYDVYIVWSSMIEINDAFFFHANDFATWSEDSGVRWYFPSLAGLQIHNPVVAANDGDFIALTEMWFWNETYDMYDKDVWAWIWNDTGMGPTYSMMDLWLTPVANLWPDHEDVENDWNETSPQIEFIGTTGQDKKYYVATYQWNGTTQMIYTYNAGWNWTTSNRDVPAPNQPESLDGDPKKISGDDFVIGGYRSAHIGEGGKKFIYTHSNQDPLPDYFLRYGDIWKRGDASGDDSVDLGDVVWLVNYLFKSDARPLPPASGDVQFDENIDLGDVVYLVSYLFKGFPAPPHNLYSCP